MDITNELEKEFRSEQQKFLYYLAAINTASIAYSIDKLLEAKLQLVLIPLILAIILFALSVFLIFKFIGKKLHYLKTNIDILNLQNHHPQDITIQINHYLKKLAAESNKVAKIFTWAFRCFYLAIFSIFTWAILLKV